jgi:alpha-tubulin suppressor-like RCC1 family protein
VYKPHRIGIVSIFAAGLLLSLGCNEDVSAPSAQGEASPSAALATAGTPLSFRQISSGYAHSCGVTTDDRAYCWGYNHLGMLGTGGPVANPDRDLSTWPVAVTGGLRFRLVSVGAHHACGLTTDDLAYCWGWNHLAQLGDGTRMARSKPTPVAGGRRYRQLRVGSAHTCAVTYADVAFCWGDNTYGQLGDGTTHGPLRPIRVAGAQLLRRVLPGATHTCGSAPGGKTYCWGSNDFGQLGDGTRTQRLTPVAVQGGLLFSQMSAGYLHSCGVSNGLAYCWGRNRWGQLGDGTMTPRLQPAPVAGGLRFAGVSAGNEYTCGVTTAAKGYCWGHNHSGRLGDGEQNSVRLTPFPIQGGLLFSSIYADVSGGLLGGYAFGWTTCGVTTGAKGYCWGSNWLAQAGVDRAGDDNLLTPAAVNAPR